MEMPVIRKLIQNKNGQYTITLPKTLMDIMDAKAGEKFKFIYLDQNTLQIIRMGCNAE